MLVNSDPARSFCPSRLQNVDEDLSGRVVDLPMNGTANGSEYKKNNPITDLIDFSSPDITRTDNDILSNEQLMTPKECNDDHLVRYSDLITCNLESRPITEKMDHWYLDLKRNLINEFDKLRLQFLEEAQENTLREKQDQVKQYIRLNQDIKKMREILIHYEQTIDQKDQTEKNLNKALDLLYHKTISYHHYYEWRIVYIEKRRQKYSLSLAKRFYEGKIKRKVLTSWKNMIEREWKKHIELACEKESKSILNEFELKYKELELELLNAHEEITRLKMDKNEQNESLKKTFMRGVCALNMEAMSVLLKDEQEFDATKEEQQRRQYSKHKDNDNSDGRLLDEDVTFTGSSTTGDGENELKYTSHHHTYPSRVYKEYLPSTIYPIGGGRSIHCNNLHRHVIFHKRRSMVTSRPRSSNNNILVERHAPTTNIRS